MYFLLRTLSYSAMALNRIFFFSMLLLVITLIAPYLPIPSNWAIFQKIFYLGHKMLELFSLYFPVDSLKKTGLLPYVLLVLLFAFNKLFKFLDDFFFEKAILIKFSMAEGGEIDLEGLSKKYKNHSGVKLLKDFMSMKSALEAMGRDLAFLSIDIVDSTKMKLNEDVYTVTYTFNNYRTFVEERLAKMNCIKSTWTPDGLMACFEKTSEAIGVAKLILTDLDDFNQDVKMHKKFSVRCGINSGHLFFDESLELEQITDRVIDIAGHMQKYAEPNSIFIPEMVALAQENSKSYENTGTVVDELLVYKWTIKST